tara:strand:- start:329 stop:559 length:231 start_codon:yes stop_codon:yes gene_type:complete
MPLVFPRKETKMSNLNKILKTNPTQLKAIRTCVKAIYQTKRNKGKVFKHSTEPYTGYFSVLLNGRDENGRFQRKVS